MSNLAGRSDEEIRRADSYPQARACSVEIPTTSSAIRTKTTTVASTYLNRSLGSGL